jgi:hypothetical protein
MPVKPCLQPLEPGIWLVGEKKIRTSHAQTFKTREPSALKYGG